MIVQFFRIFSTRIFGRFFLFFLLFYSNIRFIRLRFNSKELDIFRIGEDRETYFQVAAILGLDSG